MTSPFIQERNRKMLQGIDPNKENPLQPREPAKLLWQQADDQRVAQETAVRQALEARQKPLASSIGDESFRNRLQINKAMGQDATAGVMGSMQTKQRQAAEAYAAQQQQLSNSAMMGVGADGQALANSLSQSGSLGQYEGNYAQLAAYARAGGFAEKDIPMAIAIIMAESGGNPNALNNSNGNGSTDTGLFQINSIHSGWTKSMNLNDPIQNAKAAFKIFSDAGNSWKPWVAFQNGSYNKFLKQPSSYSPAPNAVAPYTVPTTNGSGLRQVAVQTAMKSIGVPYVWGGNSLTKGVDCSGLVQQVYKSLGMSLPRTAHEQSRSTVGTRVPINQLRPGDLVAWQGGWRGPNYVGHIAVYAGNGEIIEAPRTGVPVRRRALKQGENVFGVALKFPGE